MSKIYTSTINIALLSTCLICACRTGRPDDASSVMQKTLVVIDSIGVVSGDTDLMLGKVIGACFVSSGGIVIADGMYQDLRLFTGNGIFVMRANHTGSSPLEYMYIGGIVPYMDGFVLYEDYIRHYIFYDTLLTPVVSIYPPRTRPFEQFHVMPDSSYLTWDMSFAANSNRPTLTGNLSRFDKDSTDASVVFHSIQQTASNPEDLFALYVGKPASAVDNDGRVYLACSGVHNAVAVFAPDGTLIDTLMNPREPGLRESLEIEEELLWRRAQYRVIGDWRPDPQELDVISINIQGSQGRVWVQHTSYFHPEFDVYRLDGTLEFTCTVNGLPCDEIMVFSINDDGILAWSPYPKDCARVYILSLSE